MHGLKRALWFASLIGLGCGASDPGEEVETLAGTETVSEIETETSTEAGSGTGTGTGTDTGSEAGETTAPPGTGGDDDDWMFDLFKCGYDPACTSAAASECAADLVESSTEATGLLMFRVRAEPDLFVDDTLVVLLGDGRALVQRRAADCSEEEPDCLNNAEVSDQEICALNESAFDSCACPSTDCPPCTWGPESGLMDCAPIEAMTCGDFSDILEQPDTSAG